VVSMKFISNLRNIYGNIMNESFYTYDSSKKKVVSLVRMAVFTAENYKKTRSNLWASSISYYALLSIVPILAIAFSIAKGLGVEELIRNQILKNSPLQEEALEKLILFSEKLMSSAKGGVLAGVGFIFLGWSVIKIFTLIERSFNEIWGVKRQRTIIRKFTDYFSIVLMFPIVLLLSNGVVTTLQLHFISEGSPLFFIIQWIPYMLLISFFTLLYLIIPNTKVNFYHALVAGIVVGILFQGLQISMIKFQVVLLNYNKIYGSFSVIPIFMLWQKVVWIIIILGAHLSFILQNSYKFSYTIAGVNLTFSSKRDILFVICHIMAKNYEEEGPPLTAGFIAEKLSIATGTISEMLEILVHLDIITELYSPVEDREFKIKKNVNTFTVKEFVDVLENYGFIQNIQGDEEVMTVVRNFHKVYRGSQWGTLIKDV
jgi:membrane protein